MCKQVHQLGNQRAIVQLVCDSPHSINQTYRDTVDLFIFVTNRVHHKRYAQELVHKNPPSKVWVLFLFDIYNYRADKGNKPSKLWGIYQREFNTLIPGQHTMDTEMVDRANGSPMIRPNSNRFLPPLYRSMVEKN
jgi:hypothetical protein